MGGRRQFITRTILGFGGYLVVASSACKRPGTGDAAKSPEPPAPAPPEGGLRSLTAEQYAVLAAACERILPHDQDPGATDLGCAGYIDRALADPEVRSLWGRPLLGGLPVLDRQCHTRFQRGFAAASPEQQDQLLSAWQQSTHSGEAAFFEVLHTLTLEAAFGDPSHGGNRGGQGFLLVGFVPPPPTPLVPLQKK